MKKQEAKRLAKVLNWLQGTDDWGWKKMLSPLHFVNDTTDADTRYGVYYQRPDGEDEGAWFVEQQGARAHLVRQIARLNWETVEAECQYLLYNLQYRVMRRKEAKRLARVLNWLFLNESDACWVEAKRILTDGRIVWSVVFSTCGDAGTATTSQLDAWRLIQSSMRIRTEEEIEAAIAATV